MKRVISLILVLTLVLSCAVLVACGGKEDTTDQGTTQTSEPSTTSTSGVFWSDMPVYTGATQIQKGTWAIPATEDDDYSKFEWRYYETKDSLDKVAAFYKSKMPDNGWTEQGWMEIPQMNWGMYFKNNEKDAAMIWFTYQDGKTVIAMWRATE